MQAPLRNGPTRSPWRLIPTQAKFNIYHGKGNSRLRHGRETRLLPIQYLVYETLVNGISSAIQQQDFKGAILIDYELDGEKYYIVFAMWYSKSEQIYFLSSLGQYSSSDFYRWMQQFKTANEYRLKIKLAPIHQEGLANLKDKLARANLSGANVCLIEETITSMPISRTAKRPRIPRVCYRESIRPVAASPICVERSSPANVLT